MKSTLKPLSLFTVNNPCSMGANKKLLFNLTKYQEILRICLGFTACKILSLDDLLVRDDLVCLTIVLSPG